MAPPDVLNDSDGKHFDNSVAGTAVLCNSSYTLFDENYVESLYREH